MNIDLNTCTDAQLYEYLTGYFAQFYTKSALIELVATHCVEQSAIPYPPDWPDVDQYLPAGNPGKAVYKERRAKLLYIIQSSYPQPLDLARIGKSLSMSKRSIAKLQSNEEFLTELGPLAPYFQSMPLTQPRSRLSYTWRVLLDVHNYQLLQQYPGQRLPLYQMHALIFGVQINPAHLLMRDAKERTRLVTDPFAGLIRQAGWEPLRKPTKQGPTLGELEPNGCPLVQAYTSKVLVEHVQTARDLLAPAPWLEVKSIWLKGLYATVLAQLLGLM
jgi:hypothetical protein